MTPAERSVGQRQAQFVHLGDIKALKVPGSVDMCVNICVIWELRREVWPKLRPALPSRVSSPKVRMAGERGRAWAAAGERGGAARERGGSGGAGGELEGGEGAGRARVAGVRPGTGERLKRQGYGQGPGERRKVQRLTSCWRYG